MNTKIKTLFFALCLAVSATVNAQDAPKKYEFVTVSKWWSTGEMIVSYAGKACEKIKLSDTKNYADHHELLSYVENLENEDWQVFSFSENQAIFTIILRREKK